MIFLKKEVIELLKDLEAKDAGERVKGLPSSERMRNITPDVGLFLNILVKATKAKSLLEIGTSSGYSTIWLVLATQENKGQLITLAGLQSPKDFTVMKVWGKTEPGKIELTLPSGEVFTGYGVEKARKWVEGWFKKANGGTA